MATGSATSTFTCTRGFPATPSRAGLSPWKLPPLPAVPSNGAAWATRSQRGRQPADGVRRRNYPVCLMVRLDRIYTRAGDAGQTSLGDGERVSKASARIWAYGMVDETGAAVGVAIASGLRPDVAALLRRGENDRFDVGADLSVPIETMRGKGKSRLRIAEAHVTALEAA